MFDFVVEFVNWKHFPAVISIVVAALAAVAAIITTRMNRKNQLALENRKMKQDIYFRYLDAIGDYGNIAKNLTPEDKQRNANAWVDAHNRLVLVANPKAVNAMLDFEDCAKKSEEEQRGEYDSKLDNMIRAFRADLLDDKKCNDGIKQLNLLSVKLDDPTTMLRQLIVNIQQFNLPKEIQDALEEIVQKLLPSSMFKPEGEIG